MSIVLLTISLQPALTITLEQQSAAGRPGLAESETIVRSTPIEQALDALRARFPNRIVVGFEELFDQHPETEPQVDLGPKDSPLEEVLNRIRGIDPKYRIELLPGGLVHVHPALQTADPVGLLDIRLREFSMPQDSCFEQAIENIDERGYAPELSQISDPAQRALVSKPSASDPWGGGRHTREIVLPQQLRGPLTATLPFGKHWI